MRIDAGDESEEVVMAEKVVVYRVLLEVGTYMGAPESGP